ncbi:DUF3408 domain-containing protein [Phocaeicola dorei]|nr:DUF3408 domain-containing protein [Phocaeicola dorei]
MKEPLPMQQSVQTDTVRKRPAATSARMKAGASRSLFSWKHRKSKRGNVYISREIHEKVAIVASRMGNGLSIGKFVDNILRDHFRQYGQQYMEQIENAQKVRL